MPTWLTWKLFWKIAPYVGAVLLLLGAVWFLDHRGYQRAKHEAELADAREEASRLQMRAEIDRQVQGLEGRMQKIVSESDTRLRQQIDSIEVQNRTIIQPTITREIQNGPPRLTDPGSGITPGLRDALNAARAQSGCPNSATPDSRTGCPLPAR